MSTVSMNIAVSHGLQLGLWPFLVGLVVVALLVGAFWMGVRVRRRESEPPRPEEQPRLPEGGPVGEVMENREPDEVPRGGDRLTPHELRAHGNLGSRTSATSSRPRWENGGGEPDERR
ncbi:DUF6479 family protein [Streptomyces sp. NPDC052040]|uniref:DUF6479 family protein n=1 Tax=Streptomyces sp. NPDC052040 TaxID=3365682 RepID=UPI0037D92E45